MEKDLKEKLERYEELCNENEGNFDDLELSELFADHALEYYEEKLKSCPNKEEKEAYEERVCMLRKLNALETLCREELNDINLEMIDTNEKIAFQYDNCGYTEYEENSDLNDFLQEWDKKYGGQSFTSYLIQLLDRKNLKDSDLYKACGVLRQTYSNAKKTDSPSRKTIYSLAIGLHLNLDETELLLNLAGYTIKRKSRFDAILAYCITRKIYNITIINILLDSKNQSLLPNNFSENYEK